MNQHLNRQHRLNEVMRRALARGTCFTVLGLVGISGTWAQGNHEKGRDAFVLAIGSTPKATAVVAGDCMRCHKDPQGSGSGTRSFPVVDAVPAQYATLEEWLRALLNDQMRGYAPNTDPLDNETLLNIAAYLRRSHFPTATLPDPSDLGFGTTVIGEASPAQTLVLKNEGTESLEITAVAVDNSFVVALSCTAPSTPTVIVAGGNCSINVTFKPEREVEFTDTAPAILSIHHSRTTTTLSTVRLTGRGVKALTVTPSQLPFTSSKTGTLNLTEWKGHQVQVCRDAAQNNSFPGDFTVDTRSFQADCFDLAAQTTLGTSQELVVRFAPPLGKTEQREATLTFQRLNAGVTEGPLISVALVGNPGALLVVKDLSLFDAVDDPAVDIDNDTLVLPITVRSQGRDKVAFDAATFAITPLPPTTAGEYQIATGTAGECPALDGLPGAPTPDEPLPFCVLNIRFNPTGIGLRPAALEIRVGGKVAHSIALNGTGARGPRLAVASGGVPLASGTVVRFGPQLVGSAHSQALTLKNAATQGRGPLEIRLLDPASPAGFTAVADTGCTSLAADAQCTLAVRFEPAAARSYGGPLVIRSRRGGSTGPFEEFTLNLAGEGSDTAVPALHWTDETGTAIGSLSFEDTDAGTTRFANLRLYNAGPGAATVTFAGVAGTDSSSFALENTGCPVGKALFAMESCLLTVRFHPGSAGAKTAALQAAASAGAPDTTVSAEQLALAGRGIGAAATATLAIAPTSLRFDPVIVGASSEPLDVLLSNAGNRSLRIIAFETTPPFAAAPQSCATPPFDLHPGAECTVALSVRPEAEGELLGTLSVRTDAGTLSQDVPLAAAGGSQADLSGGGCSISTGESLLDPTLWLLAVLAAVVLAGRQLQRRGAQPQKARP